jgi:hypothetical protein
MAHGFGYITKPETRFFDADSPNGKLMVAVCARILISDLKGTFKGEAIAKDVWEWIQSQKRLEVVPWNKDFIYNARHEGFQDAVYTLERFMVGRSDDLRNQKT